MTDHPTRPIRRWGTGDERRPPVVVEAPSLPPPSDDDDPQFHRGARFGRFIVLGKLGAGGMGVVISAFDPDLDRKVAIKVLRPDPTGTPSAPDARAAMVREAKAMARLAHPNVVTVHEVGTAGDDFFLVMELVDGETLAAWMERKLPWREVVAAFVAAGRGLAAAHAAALVHRDFKPHNVLLGKDGRVRVTDFGVCGVAGSTSGAEFVLGTPAYMAPEQHRHEPLDGRADQFSFCVALYEALYHVRPFDAETPDALRAAILETPAPPPADRHGVPARIEAIVLRGLAQDPVARFSSMNALLAALESDPWRSRRRVAAALGVTALAGLAVFGWTRGDAATPSACADAEEELAGVWDASVKRDVHDAFVDARPAQGAATYARVAARLDTYADGWTEAYAAACEAPGGATGHGFHAGMACLAELRDELRELTGLFQHDADGVVMDGAVAAVAALSPVEACAAVRHSADAVVADPTAVDEVRRRLGRAEALRRAGLLQPAAALADEVARDAGALGDARLIAEAELLRGLVRMRSQDGVGAEVALAAAARAAATAGDDLVIARAVTALFWVIGHLRARPEEALAMRPLAEAAVVRAGDPARLRAELRFYIGGVMIELGRYDEAIVELERARAIWAEELDPHDPEAARPILSLGNVAGYRGHLDESRVYYLEALGIREAALGPDHPDLAGPLGNLGSLEMASGDPAAAITYCTRSLAIVEAALGKQSRSRTHQLKCLAEAARETGDRARARLLLDEAIALDDGDPDGGYQYYTLTELGQLTNDEGDHAAALALCNRALAMFDTDALRDHPDNAYALTCRGRALLGIGGGASARAPLERALLLRETTGAGPRDLADTRFALARALWDSPRERGRARALAEQARDGYRTGHAAPLEVVEAWLVEHPAD